LKENEGVNVSNIVEKRYEVIKNRVLYMLREGNTQNINKKLLEELYYNKRNTLEEIGSRFDLCIFSIAKLMDKYDLKRRNRSEATYNYYNKEECFNIKTNLNEELELLKNTALMLYWCEGTGDSRIGKKNVTLAFTNTDVEMLCIWLKFLLEVCQLRQKKIKVRLYVHKNQDGDSLKKYWSQVLKIPLCQFENVSYTKKISTRDDYKGTVKVKVHNLKLYLLIKEWIEDLKEKILKSPL